MVDQPPPLVRPVPGAVVAAFTYVRADPFAAGRRRVLRLRAARGTPVRAPCSGRVRFAGRTPGGDAVAVRCGAWSATLTGLGAVTRRSGARVTAGAPVARAGGGRGVGLGLRLARDPFGYVDPAPRLGEPADPGTFSPLGPAPRGRRAAPRSAPVPGPAVAPRPALGPRPTLAPRPAPTVRPTPGRVVVPDGGAVALPTVAWAGLGLAALGLPVGLAGRRRVLRLRQPTASGRVAAR
ncbi:peptidoglycan DD-metalloendopeptidase family protein [Patulibacter americanus]|uniref:peptidoglycan DD-metalloendopeptidase family protein n=1 Tax=Patulibacter americanus TaxID=588672 RepID=UPI0003B3B974|nr:peptidoglycan DD-metalloendopeptidase family protein [Patulibacter americanus]